MKTRTENSKTKISFFRRETAVFFVICTLCISSILRSGFYYKDDLGRFLEGYRRWNISGRMLSDALSILLNMDMRAADLSPVSQLLAAAVMAFAGILLLDIFREEKKHSFVQIAMVLPLAISPYFLECFCFKFDAPYMALSVFFSILPFRYVNRGRKVYIVSSVLCLMGMCLFYQAASGIYPMIVLFLAFEDWNAGKRSVKETGQFIGICALSYIAAMLLYRILFMRALWGYEGYKQDSVVSLWKLPSVAARNYIMFYGRIWLDLKKTWMVLFLLVILLAWIRMILRSERKKPAAAFAAAAVLFAASILADGVYLVLDDELLAPRMMLGFGALTALLNLQAGCPEEGRIRAFLKKEWVFGAAGIALSWCFFTYGLVYGNSLLEQGRYTQLRSQILLDDLKQLPAFKEDGTVKVKIVGDIGKAPAVRGAIKNCTILRREVPDTLGSYQWGRYYLLEYLGLPNAADARSEAFPEDLPVTADNVYETIRAEGKYVQIELKEP